MRIKYSGWAVDVEYAFRVDYSVVFEPILGGDAHILDGWVEHDLDYRDLFVRPVQNHLLELFVRQRLFGMQILGDAAHFHLKSHLLGLDIPKFERIHFGSGAKK